MMLVDDDDDNDDDCNDNNDGTGDDDVDWANVADYTDNLYKKHIDSNYILHFRSLLP